MVGVIRQITRNYHRLAVHDCWLAHTRCAAAFGLTSIRSLRSSTKYLWMVVLDASRHSWYSLRALSAFSRASVYLLWRCLRDECNCIDRVLRHLCLFLHSMSKQIYVPLAFPSRSADTSYCGPAFLSVWTVAASVFVSQLCASLPQPLCTRSKRGTPQTETNCQTQVLSNRNSRYLIAVVRLHGCVQFLQHSQNFLVRLVTNLATFLVDTLHILDNRLQPTDQMI